jgi:hypothetical protein
MFPSFPRYKEVAGGRGQIEPGPPVVVSRLDAQNPDTVNWNHLSKTEYT